MKTVGIFLRDYKSLSNHSLLAIRSDLLLYLRKYNVQVICIPISFQNNIDTEFERVVECLQLCQGVILPGGQAPHEIDIKIVKYLHQQDIPTLGICLGMQIMSLAFEGDLKMLPCTDHQKEDKYVHTVKIKKNSLLHKILGDDYILVNSRHSEHITTTELSVSAIADDLVIEAVEDAQKRFFIGVQWHPESLMHDSYSKKLFNFFIDIL